MTVGSVAHPAEEQADQMAAVVVRSMYARAESPETLSDSPAQPSPAGVARLQRLAGNRATVQTLERRTPGQPGVVRRTPESPAPGPEAGPEGGEVSPAVAERITAARGGGRSLNKAERSALSPIGGAPLWAVRLHAGPEAASLNRLVGAKAFTLGSDIFFRGLTPDIADPDGLHTLAHEVAHTAQQGRQGPSRQHLVQREDDDDGPPQHTQVKALKSGMKVKDSVGASGQLGHAMDVWVDIDLGKNPTAPPNARPNSVYGLEMEYWEWVDVPHDNQGATGTKPWNDIHGMKPDASTFDTKADGCSMTWKAAVEAARAGTLKGKHRIGFRDIPGLYEKANRDVERTLKFRIVFNDGKTPQEMFATQLLRVTNGQLAYSAYVDDVGNKLESHGFHSAGYKRGSSQEKRKVRAEPGRLTAAALPSTAGLLASIPDAAKTELQPFMADVLAGRADPFVDLEEAQVIKSIAADKQTAAAGNWTMMAKSFLGDVAGGVAAGNFLLPQIDDTRRWQRKVTGGGLLVGLASTKEVLSVYFTDGTTKAISADASPSLQGKNLTLNLRSYSQFPTEAVRAGQGQTGPAVTKNVKVKDDAARLRSFTQRGERYTVQVTKAVGSRVKQGDDVAIFDPAVRDVSGEWIKATSRGKIGFVRVAALEGVGSAFSWKREMKGATPAVAGAMSMMPFLKAHFAQHGNSHASYSSLVADYPGLVEDIDKAYTELYGAPQLHKVRLDASTATATADVQMFSGLAARHSGKPVAMATAVMGYLRSNQGRGDLLESVYNQHVPPLGHDVPPTLGELVHGYFTSSLRRRGKGPKVYNSLKATYPDFAYRLKPAYREVFGDKQLQTMLVASEQAEGKKDIPDPHSAGNQIDYLDFIIQKPLTFADFVPTAGTGTSKFDVALDPSTGKLDIVVKVFYHFADDTTLTPTSLAGESPQFGQQFGRNTWDPQDMADWKTGYADSTAGIFNRSGHKIQCTKPGWESITVTPNFMVQEVPFGQQHFVVEASKAALTGTGTDKKMKSTGSSKTAKGKLNNVDVIGSYLQEWDIYDKFQDPRLHTYLHAAENPNVANAYLLDRRRLEEVLGRLGRLPASDSGDKVIDPAVRNLADALRRLEIPSSLAALHPLVVTASGSSVGSGLARAKRFMTKLQAKEVPNQMEAVGVVGPGRGITITAKPADAGVQQNYVNSWHRFTAAHEFGHMIGLIDEYYEASSAETVKEMISAGWLPPDTRADHLKLNPPKSVAEKVDQEMTLSLTKRAGLESPDFAMGTASDSPKTTSLMTGGFDIQAVHMITVWEALATVTKSFVDERYWKIT